MAKFNWDLDFAFLSWKRATNSVDVDVGVGVSGVRLFASLCSFHVTSTILEADMRFSYKSEPELSGLQILLQSYFKTS